jgi:hypothetical protein
MKLWIFNCQQVSRLVSKSMDRKLPLIQKMGIRFHLMMCRLCSNYRRQLIFMRRLLQISRQHEDTSKSDLHLPLNARERIQKELTSLK